MNDRATGRAHFQEQATERGPSAERSAEARGERRFWRWTAMGLGAIAFGKGIREPNAWPYTHAQLNYSAGFIRRGLYGAALGHPLGLNLYGHYVVVSTVLLLLLFAALVLLARSSKLAERTPPGELLAVYASSYGVSYLASLNGYLDISLALLCVAPLFVRRTGWRLAAAAVAAVVGILIHEQFCFAYLPLLIVSVLFGAATAKSVAERRLAWGGGVLLAALGLGLMTYLSLHGSVTAAQSDALWQSMARTADRPLDVVVLKVLHFTPRQNLEIMKSVWRRPTYPLAQAESLLLFGPTAAVLSWATLLLLRRWMPGKHRWLYAGVLLGTLSPLSLHLMGWDKNRWNEMLCLNAFLMLLVVSRLLGAEAVQLPVRLRRACVVVMLLNMASGGAMMDDRQIRPFPFMHNPDVVSSSAPVTHP
jgi:hypothetical protein